MNESPNKSSLKASSNINSQLKNDNSQLNTPNKRNIGFEQNSQNLKSNFNNKIDILENKTRYSNFLYRISMIKLENEGSKRNFAKERREETISQARVGFLTNEEY